MVYQCAAGESPLIGPHSHSRASGEKAEGAKTPKSRTPLAVLYSKSSSASGGRRSAQKKKVISLSQSPAVGKGISPAESEGRAQSSPGDTPGKPSRQSLQLEVERLRYHLAKTEDTCTRLVLEKIRE